MEMIINTVRSIHKDQTAEQAFGNAESLKNNLAIAFIHPESLKKLNVQENSNIKITSEYGSIVLKVIQDDSVPENVINVPISIWANQITGVLEQELVFKHEKGIVKPTTDPILTYEELLKRINSIE